MSDQATQRRIPLAVVADLVPRGGEFNLNDRFSPSSEVAFIPWNKGSFKPIETAVATVVDDLLPQTDSFEPQSDVAIHAEAPPPPPPPPPEPAEPPPSPEEILAAIEKSREDGRALGYQQGLDASRRELGDAIATLRKLETELMSLAHDSFERNAEIMARHVRRLAQDLFGTMFAEMPVAFVERIKNAAEMFTKAGGEFTLALNPHDRMTLATALKETEIFDEIRIIEDDDLKLGSFRLFSRDLQFDDIPTIEEN